MMENINAGFYNIRGQIAELHAGINKGMEWYKKEMDSLKQQLTAKDQEIEELKKKLNEKSA